MSAASAYQSRIDYLTAWLATTDATDAQRQRVERVIAAYQAALACRTEGGCGATRTGVDPPPGPASPEPVSQDHKSQVTTQTCRRAHLRTDANTYSRDGKLYCRPCRRDEARRRRQRGRAA